MGGRIPFAGPKWGGNFPQISDILVANRQNFEAHAQIFQDVFLQPDKFFCACDPKICGFGRAGQRFFFCDSGQLEQFDAGNQSGGWSACWKSAITSLSLALFGSMVTCFCPPLRFIYTLNGHDAGFPTPTWASRVKKPRDCRPNFGQHRTPTVKKKLSRL